MTEPFKNPYNEFDEYGDHLRWAGWERCRITLEAYLGCSIEEAKKAVDEWREDQKQAAEEYSYLVKKDD